MPAKVSESDRAMVTAGFEDREDEAEGRDRFREPLAVGGAHRIRQLPERKLEHEVGGQGANNSADKLARDVKSGDAPRKLAAQRECGAEKGAPAIVGAGMMGDRADVIFASPDEISAFISHRC